MNGIAVKFDDFEFFPGQRHLLQAGKPLRVGSRSLDILIALVDRAGEIVSKDELIARVWPNTFVEEASLRVHIGTLRKALGDDPTTSRFIANIPGRGYCFVAPISRTQTIAPQPAPSPSNTPARTLPAPVARIIGRDEIVATIVAQLGRHRLLSVVGPGGIGKTTVTLAVAEIAAASFKDGIAFVDLASISDPQLVAGVLASALGHALRSDNAVRELVSSLHGREILVVLDSCEHVIDTAAAVAEALVKGTTGVTVLASSREPLRADGEWVQRLSPLDVPSEASVLSAENCLRFSAVRLFVERASASLGGYELTAADAPVVAEICRRLDGIALAIELAAGRLDTIGIQGLAGSLNDCFRVLTRGRRTALPRHQTLRATLDWSYQLLPPTEQSVLRHLAVFTGAFTLEAATEILQVSGMSSSEIEDGVLNLMAKSLVAVEVMGPAVRYRMLDTTRAYAQGKLDETAEGSQLRRSHAEFYKETFEQAEAEWESRSAAEWLASYVGQLGNLRSALDWAYSSAGDAAIGVALTVAAVPLWFQLSLVDECLGRVQTALAIIDAAPNGDDRQKMRLHAALGWPRMRAISGLPSGVAAWKTALEIAEKLGDRDYQIRALWALWVDRSNSGEPREALALAERFCALATSTGDHADICIGDRMRARSLHLLGEPAEAHRFITQMLDRYAPPPNKSHSVRFQYDQRITARITLARVLWVQGLPDQALSEVESNIEDALALGHVLSLAHALSDAACPVTLLAGRLDRATRFTDLLRTHTQAHALDVWNTYADCFEGELLARKGDLAQGVKLMSAAIDKLAQTGFVLYRTAFLGSLAEALGQSGDKARGLTAIDAALTRCEQSGEAWYLAELHRIRGELLPAPDAAEAAFARAVEIARGQGALAWELRAAVSLAKLWHGQNRTPDARHLLAPVYARFTEGFQMPDLLAAADLLKDLG